MPELAFSYIDHMPGIASIVFGVESPERVQDNIALLRTPAIREQTLHEMAKAFADVSEFVITPSRWKGK
ncbi:hypothetical protein [Paenibacillus whitsoniae]|uniref:hypothetical protein n=1 Tax=Paenibacillus whitsoniae TaxID=2496558 RepID=UPI0013E0D3D6|nr:hypothetical protein [Paenibacillus whitsoniae]